MAEEPEYVRAARARAMRPEQRDPAAATYPWETIHVTDIPTPPSSPMADTPGHQQSQSVSLDEAINRSVRTHVQEIATDLGAMGLRFDPRMQADLADYCFALLSGIAGGGAIPRRT